MIVVVFKILIFLARNLKNADLMGGKADAVIHVSLGDKELKTKVNFNIFLLIDPSYIHLTRCMVI